MPNSTTFVACFPSGGRMVVSGRPSLLRDHGCLAVVSDDPKGPVHVLDPRVLLVDLAGQVVWNPRRNMGRLPRWVRRWLMAHPEWGREVAA